jgi:hypothetical protein
LLPLDPLPDTNVFRCLQITAARKNRNPLKQALFRISQLRIAPVDGRPQRLVARQRRALSVREQLETILQTLGNLRSAQRAQARGRQLNGQRNAL